MSDYFPLIFKVTVTVALTVILAYVIAAFVFGMAGNIDIPHKVCYCSVQNESAVEAAWLDGYHAGYSRAYAGNDTGWSWNYSVPEGAFP